MVQTCCVVSESIIDKKMQRCQLFLANLSPKGGETLASTKEKLIGNLGIFSLRF